MSTKKKNVGRKPMRLCVCCNKEYPKGEMLRIVVSGRNTEVDEAFVDPTGRQHGRGAYVCKSISCIEKAFDDGMIDAETKKTCISQVEAESVQILSIIMKAGGIAAGEFQCEEALDKSDAYFVIIAEDASDNTKKKFIDKCIYRGIPYKILGTKEKLGNQIGKAERSVIAIKNADFGAGFIHKFGGNE